MPVVVVECNEKGADFNAVGTENTGKNAEKAGRVGMKRKRQNELTTPDLVLLSLLTERAMHGYQANLELERRCVRDWAGISRPQVYYSLEKLAEAGLVRAAESDEPAVGPERRVFDTTAKGRTALGEALEREEWATQRERPLFLTWVALSWQARPGVFARQIARRREFLQAELAREEQTLREILEETGHPYHEAVWMVSLMAEQFRVELKWLKKVEQELKRRGRAKHPAYVEARKD
jgi:DNA-binding PadR family transcriptional regulator